MLAVIFTYYSYKERALRLLDNDKLVMGLFHKNGSHIYSSVPGWVWSAPVYVRAKLHPGKQYGHSPDLSAEGMAQLLLPMHQMDFILLPLLPSQTHLFISKIAV